MKKILTLFTAFSLCTALSSCSTGDEDSGEKLQFSTTNIYGNSYTSESMKSSKVVLVNYWEPWCKPCLSEMPDLQRLYENYSDQGLSVIGIFSDTSAEADAKSVIASKKITYTVIHGTADTAKYAQSYIPSTIFTDGDGNILSDEAIIGAQSYEDLEILVQRYLDQQS